MAGGEVASAFRGGEERFHVTGRARRARRACLCEIESMREAGVVRAWEGYLLTYLR